MRQESPLSFTVIPSVNSSAATNTQSVKFFFKSAFLKQTLNQKSNKEKVYSPIWLDFKQTRIATPDYFFKVY